MRGCLLVLLMLLPVIASAEAPGKLWSHTYGGSGHDEFFSMQQTSDGGYVCAGWTNSSGMGGYDFWLVKTDGEGNLQWKRTYGGGHDDRCCCVQQTAEGGYILAGVTKSFGVGTPTYWNCWVVKTDAGGNQLWAQTYGGGWEDEFYSVRQTAEGGYIFGGYTAVSVPNYADFWLVKTDAGGNQQWNRVYGDVDADACYSVQQTSDGGYIMGGFNYSTASIWDVWLLKTGANGNRQWSRIFGGSGDDRCYSVQETSDGGYLLGGYTSSFGSGSADAYVIRTDAEGFPEWTRTFGGSANDACSSVRPASDGGCVMAGYTMSGGAGDADAWIVKTDSDGNELWHDTYGGSGREECLCVQQTTEGGYALAGFTDSFGAGDWDGWLVKTAPEGGNDPPVADAGGPYRGSAGEPITFDASGSFDPDGAIVGYRWDWTNDGEWDTDWLIFPRIAHAYPGAFDGQVCVEVRDNEGLTDTDVASVHICRPSPVITSRGDPNAGPETSEKDHDELPTALVLEEGHPNPFAGTTELRYSLPSAGDVELHVYDMAGRRLRTLVSGREGPGYQVVRWDGTDDSGRRLSPGVYLCRLEVAECLASKKLVLMSQ